MVKPEMRFTAQAVATLSFNMIGYLPAPFIYGFVSDLPLGSPVKQQRCAIASILYALILASIFLSSAFVIKYELCCLGEKADKRKTLAEWNGQSNVRFDSDPFTDLNPQQQSRETDGVTRSTKLNKLSLHFDPRFKT